MNDEQLEALLRAAGRMDESVARLPRELSTQVRLRKQRNERRRRRVAAVAVLAGGYLAGLATMWLWNTAAAVPERAVVDRSGPAADERSELLAALPADGLRRAAPPPGQPEHAIVFPQTSAYESLRRLGDEYLHGKGDVVTAVEFYRRALDEASPDELAGWDESDSWLLRSLKRDRLALAHENGTGDAI
jgi:hypothetical protein